MKSTCSIDLRMTAINDIDKHQEIINKMKYAIGIDIPIGPSYLTVLLSNYWRED